MVPCSVGAWHPSTEHINLSLPNFSLNPILPWAHWVGFFSTQCEREMEEMAGNGLSLKGKLPSSMAAPRGLPGLCSDDAGEGPGIWPCNLWHCLLEQHMDPPALSGALGPLLPPLCTQAPSFPATWPCPSSPPCSSSLELPWGWLCLLGTWVLLDQVACACWIPISFWKVVTLGGGPTWAARLSPQASGHGSGLLLEKWIWYKTQEFRQGPKTRVRSIHLLETACRDPREGEGPALGMKPSLDAAAGGWAGRIPTWDALQ